MTGVLEQHLNAAEPQEERLGVFLLTSSHIFWTCSSASLTGPVPPHIDIVAVRSSHRQKDSLLQQVERRLVPCLPRCVTSGRRYVLDRTICAWCAGARDAVPVHECPRRNYFAPPYRTNAIHEQQWWIQNTQYVSSRCTKSAAALFWQRCSPAMEAVDCSEGGAWRLSQSQLTKPPLAPGREIHLHTWLTLRNCWQIISCLCSLL